ncbi:hypothetical protein [Candidatus Neptunochlamydia vexilliferae]|uniref:Uncharacterized protein n=1 Tax=Candidatus Neptunichlamydia vexilliferae TaxID=1651774 RepID=A0ABS0AXI2_9BACT|nr:hypothetical protein [Candidatus Neptunochlamydia vexilliferae]MBF5058680.1 hypothetical protein [Candidatus Neptunochlamydia vexilliferae]
MASLHSPTSPCYLGGSWIQGAQGLVTHLCIDAAAATVASIAFLLIRGVEDFSPVLCTAPATAVALDGMHAITHIWLDKTENITLPWALAGFVLFGFVTYLIADVSLNHCQIKLSNKRICQYSAIAFVGIALNNGLIYLSAQGEQNGTD